jgi:class 3 adenylate cyclase
MVDYPEGSPPPLPGQAEERFRIEGPVTSAARAWRLVGDTDWLNRVGGNGAVLSMAVRHQADGFPLLVGEMGAPFGMRIPFAEVWASWVNERFFRQVRDLKSPLVARSDYRAELVPVEGGVRPVIELALQGPGWGALVRRGLSLSGMERRWTAALQKLGEPEGVDGAAPRTLYPEAVAALQRWRGAADPRIVDRFEQAFRSGRPGDLARLRAFVLADAWGLDRDAVLEALLAGVDGGAVELFWSVRCARCYGQVASGRLLSDVADHVDCPACGVRSETDLGDNVEVLFAPHPSVVRELDLNFCTVYPAAAPSQRTVLTLAPGQKVRVEAPVPPGEWRFGVGGDIPDIEVTAGREGAACLRWRGHAEAPVTVRAGAVELDVENPTPGRARVYLTQLGGALPIVPAALLTAKDSFRRRLGHQVLSPELRVGVRSITLLFTDLGGSTAMYEELGDARAFSVVRDHFAVLRGAAARRGGTVVKTIGDAVMAAFFDAPSAMEAALDMQTDFASWAGGLGMAAPPSLKVGLHRGTALAVHTDQSGLDYFGGTVNLAARAQGVAGAGEVVWTEAIADDEGVRAVLGRRGVTGEPFSAALKGLGDVPLFRARP